MTFTRTYIPFPRQALSVTNVNEVRVEDTDFTYTNDVTYNQEFEEFLKISSGRSITIPFDLSISDSGDTAVQHVLTASAPSWVTVDQTDSVIKIDTSNGQYGVRYDFDIITTVPPSTWTHTKSVSVMVLE